MDSHVITLLIDGLRPAFLGPYGNTWCETPTFNRIASRALLFEHALATSTKFDDAYRSLWMGCHPSESLTGEHLSLPVMARRLGFQTVLITDCQLVAGRPESNDFDELVVLDRHERPSEAEDISHTGFAETITNVVELLQRLDRPSFVWIHLSGLRNDWDAPYEMRVALLDEEDPDPPDFIASPSLLIDDADPDQLLGFAVAYAAQIQVVDYCLSVFWEVIESAPFRAATVLVTAFGGYPLGEHGMVGDAADCPYSEMLAIPVFLRTAGSACSAMRSQTPIGTEDLHRVLANAISKEAGSPEWALAEVGRPIENAAAIHAMVGEDWIIRTPAWLGRFTRQDRIASYQFPTPAEVYSCTELYAKPDDRWETNNVIELCPEIAAQLEAVQSAYQAQAANANSAWPDRLDVLPGDLCRPH